MFQKHCSSCGNVLDKNYINLDLIQCESCFKKWKNKHPNNPLTYHLENIYFIIEFKNKKPPKIDLGDMVV